jgi:hypothetical protein
MASIFFMSLASFRMILGALPRGIAALRLSALLVSMSRAKNADCRFVRRKSRTRPAQAEIFAHEKGELIIS